MRRNFGYLPRSEWWSKLPLSRSSLIRYRRLRQNNIGYWVQDLPVLQSAMRQTASTGRSRILIARVIVFRNTHNTQTQLGLKPDPRQG